MFEGMDAERSGPRLQILVLGVYLARETNGMVEIVASLAQCRTCDVTQRWVALGGQATTPSVQAVTVRVSTQRRPKFELINALLAIEDLQRYDYVMIMDDDIELPEGFLERFVLLQSHLGFALAQPARTSQSYYDHPIVEHQQGAIARQTRFVEIGPVVSIHRSAYPVLLPFDLTSPMGWGYSNIWARLFADHGLKMGIIDDVPVAHALRKPVANYSWDEADQARTVLLSRQEHLPLETCFRVVDVIIAQQGRLRHQPVPIGDAERTPDLTVIVATRNRPEWLRPALESLAVQSLAKTRYEVLIIDDASADATPQLCQEFQTQLPLRHLRVHTAGTSAAKNLGVFSARSTIVLFFNDDEVAHEDLLRTHLLAHQRNPEPTVAVLGAGGWIGGRGAAPLLRYVAEAGSPWLCGPSGRDNEAMFTAWVSGRLSCKRSMLIRHGVFRQELERGPAEIELGYRLSRFGLRLIREPQALTYVHRPSNVDELCGQCERQGASQWRLNRLHRRDQAIQAYYPAEDAVERWTKRSSKLETDVRRLRELEARLAVSVDERNHSAITQEIMSLYPSIFEAVLLKGFVGAMQVEQNPVRRTACELEVRGEAPQVAGTMQVNACVR